MPAAKAASSETVAAATSPRLPTGQEVHGAEREERHVEDGAEQVEGLEGPLAPADGRPGPQRQRPEGEHEQRDRPHQLVAAAAGPGSARASTGRTRRRAGWRWRPARCASPPSLRRSAEGTQAARPAPLRDFVNACTWAYPASTMAAADKPDQAPSARTRRIPEATVARLPLYLRSLLELNGGDVDDLVRAAGRAGRRERGQGPQGPVLPRLLRHPRRRLRRRVPRVPDEPRAGPHPGLARRHRRRRQPGPGPGQLRRLRRPGLLGGRAGRRRRGQGRLDDRLARGAPRRRPAPRWPPSCTSPSASSPPRPASPRTSPTGWSPPASPRC